MITLTGKLVYLRALEPEDLDFIYAIENDEQIWEISHTITPYSKFLIKQYLENAYQDIFEAKQLRLVICELQSSKTIGLIDLFDYDPFHARAGIGILIQKSINRNQGMGTEALDLLLTYAFQKLNLHQLYANISSDNIASKKLFTKFGFQFIGTKKQWNKINGQFKDEELYQCINLKNE